MVKIKHSNCADDVAREIRARRGILRFALYVLHGTVCALGIGSVAASLQIRGWAPVGIFPVLSGIVLGFVLFPAALIAGLDSRSRLITTTVAFALMLVAFEHLFLYKGFRQQWRAARENNAQISLFRDEEPWSPAEYFVREITPMRALLWSLDAVLITSGAVATVLIWPWFISRNDETRVASDAAK